VARSTTPKRATPRPPRTKDIVGRGAFVLVKSPDGVPDGTTVFARGRPALETGTASSLPLGRWNLTLIHNRRRWSGSVNLTREGPATTPVEVTLTAAGPLAGSMPVLRAVRAGVTPMPGGAMTIVYIHGIGNKPLADVLCCQWDRALFGTPLGERSRMAYWVDRARYPVPEAGTCADADNSMPGPAGMAARAASIAAPSDPAEVLIQALAPEDREQRILRRITAKIEAAAAINDSAVEPMLSPGEAAARVLPGGRLTRQWLARWLTDLFLPDVHSYLFDVDAREKMLDSLADRLRGGGEPFIVVAHSLGSVVAYELLRRFGPQDCKVALFVTIGSPLGMQEIQDHLKQGGKLSTPECVGKWINLADRLDPVAIDATLADEYGPNQTHDARVTDVSVANADRGSNPHSGTGYLSTVDVRDAVRMVAGQAFASPLARAAIAADVAAKSDAERGRTLHDVLIQLDNPNREGAPEPLAEVAARLVEHLGELAATRPSHIGAFEPPDVLRRFVAARLTRSEIESLRTLTNDLHVRLVWSNAQKRALVYTSAATTQALPAQLGYAATGRDVAWAVLDTGIDADHPHFSVNENVRAQWDCLGHGPPRLITEGDADPNGHGTHVAGIIAGGMTGRWDGRERRLSGMAPETTLYGFRVLRRDGVGSDSAIIKALDMIAAMNESASGLVIHGVNLSLGSSYDPSIYGCGHTPLCQELRRLWRQGVTVCLAAGNEGYGQFQSAAGEVGLNLALSIGDPANLEEAIAVGSVHKENPHSYGISYFSSRGPTADGRRKPDCVAPGERIVSARAGGRTAPGSPPDLSGCYVEMSGTSMATPHVSGLLAGFLSARREFIGNPDGTKRILLDNCTDLRRDPNMQGAGLVNLVRMLLGT
jgi:subtilisin family serine protease